MRYTALLALLMLPVLCGFQDEKPPAPPLPVKDTTDETIKAYIDGKSLAPYAIPLHDSPKAGQYWETGSDSYEIESSTRRQVSRLDGDFALVEQRLKLSSEMFKSDYVIAYRVRLKPERGKPQITRAWIGKPGEKPQLITVREMPVQQAETPKEDKDKGEEFKDLELAGATWKGRLYTHKFDDMTTKLWVAEGGWFDAIIKTTAGDDYLEDLRAFGSDAEPLLQWPEGAAWQTVGDEQPAGD